MSTRSLASRLDSGSSNRKTRGWRTSARPIATRWRWPPESWLGRRLQQMLDLQGLGDRRDRLVALGLRHAAHLHAEGHVLRHRHVGIERVGLEHHRDVALRRMQIVDRLAVDADLAGADRLEARDGVEQRRLAAARRADQHEEAALVERQIDALEDFERAEALAQPADFEEGHGFILSPRRPSGRARSSGRRRYRRTRSARRR